MAVEDISFPFSALNKKRKQRYLRDNLSCNSVKTCCEPSSEFSHETVLMKGYNMFSLRNKKNYLSVITDTSFVWNTALPVNHSN